ncbi:MAG: histidine phosphatase family protein [archaeon]
MAEKNNQARIILIRHAETTTNRERVFGGTINSPLTGLGKKQAKALGAFLSRERFDKIYSSPLRRAKETADEVARAQEKRGFTKVEVVKSLREQYHGSFQGKKHSQLPGELWERLRKHPADINEKVAGRESLSEMRARIGDFGRLLLGARGTVAVVSHGGTLSVLFSELTGIPLSHVKTLKFDNCSITEIILDRKLGRVYVEKLNITKHLGGLAARKKRRYDETRLILVRHGETLSNSSRIMRGKTEIPLSAEGKNQARATARVLYGEKLDFIFSSPLSRARETSEAIAQLKGARVSIEPLLAERDFGRFEGRPLADWISWRETSGRSDYTDKSHGGESQKEVELRAKKFLERRLSSFRGKTVAIVSHGNFLKILLAVILGISPLDARPFFPGNCRISELSVSLGKMPRIIRFNDDSHLHQNFTGGNPSGKSR